MPKNLRYLSRRISVHQEAARRDAGATRGSHAEALASSAAIIDALGMAHTTFTLYDDPRTVEAFGRAVEILGMAPCYPWRAEAGVDGFTVDGELVAVHRDGSLRFSRGLFSLGIAAVDFMSPPSAHDLLGLLELLTGAESPQGARQMLESSGVSTIRLMDRAMLYASDPGHDPGNDLPTTTTTVTDTDPAGFILRMMEEGDRTPRAVANRFVGEYERAHLLIDLDDTWGTEEIIHAFVDGFWYLPETHRAEIFSLMLERGNRAENIAFLDQFGGTELAQMNRMFGADGHPLLADYLRVASREGGRHGDLGDLVDGDHTQSLTARIVGQVASVLRARSQGGDTRTGTAIGRLANSQPSDADARRSVANVLGGLLSLAADAGAIESASQVWAGRVSSALAAGDLGAADDWITAATGLPLDGHSRAILLNSLSAAVTGPAVDALAALLSGPEQEGQGGTVRKAAPLFATDGLIRELGEEGKASRRKNLLKALQVIARLRPQSLLPHLADPRWFVIRNLAVALGTSHNAAMIPQLEQLATHPDHRVRIEAMRGLHRLAGESSTGILLERVGDSDLAVAAEAGRLLGGAREPGIDRRLAAQAASGDPDLALAAIAALGWRTTAEARAALGRLAHRKLAWGRARHLRAAARRALGGSR